MAPPTRDIGVIDMRDVIASQWADVNEFVPDLMWPTNVQMYARMRHDPRLAAILKAYSLPIRRATWVVDPAGCRDEAVQVVADDLGLPVLGADPEPGPARRRGVNWSEHLRLALLSLVFGHSIFERRYEIRGQQARLVNLGERMPWTIGSIDLNPDGTIKNVRQEFGVTAAIPANRLLWYAHEREGATWTGRSLLREAYGPWLLKHEMWRVHATAIRRFGMGVPTVEAPAGATPGQVAEAQRLASAMRVGDTAGAGLPNGFAFKLTGLTGSVPDAVEMIRYLDQQMSTAALAGFLDLGQTETGSRALGESMVDLFMLSLQAVADEIADVATSGQPGLTGAVTDLVDVNWGEEEPAPRIVCTDVGSRHDLALDALHELVSADVIHPDDDLESYLRTTYRLPPRKRDDVATAERSYAYDLDYGILMVDERRAQINLPPLPNGAGQVLPTPSNLRYVPPDPETGPEAPQVQARAGARQGTVLTVNERRAQIGLPPIADGDRLPEPVSLQAAPSGEVQPGGPPSAGPGGSGPASVAATRGPRRRRTQPTGGPRAATEDDGEDEDPEPPPDRRDLTPEEQQSGLDPDAVETEQQSALEELLAAWVAVQAAQIAALVTAVGDAVDGGDLEQLAALAVDSTEAATIIGVALVEMGETAAARMVAEAAAQGVKVTDPGVDADELGALAATAAALMAASTAAEAGRAALAAVAGRTGEQVGDVVRQHMEGMTDAWVRDQLAGVLRAAQAHGRFGVLDVAPAAVWIASEVLDVNSCQPCRDIDGTHFETLDDARAAYGSGRYTFCLGGNRCRGIVFALWKGDT